MAVSCDPNALMQAAACFDKCIPPGMHPAIQTYILAVSAGVSLDPTVLMQQAACFESCIPPGMQLAVQNYILCQILDALD